MLLMLSPFNKDTYQIWKRFWSLAAA